MSCSRSGLRLACVWLASGHNGARGSVVDYWNCACDLRYIGEYLGASPSSNWRFVRAGELVREIASSALWAFDLVGQGCRAGRVVDGGSWIKLWMDCGSSSAVDQHAVRPGSCRTLEPELHDGYPSLHFRCLLSCLFAEFQQQTCLTCPPFLDTEVQRRSYMGSPERLVSCGKHQYGIDGHVLSDPCVVA